MSYPFSLPRAGWRTIAALIIAGGLVAGALSATTVGNAPRPRVINNVADTTNDTTAAPLDAAQPAMSTQTRTCSDWEGGFVWFNVEGQVHLNPNGTVSNVDNFHNYLTGVPVGVDLKSSSAYYNVSNGGHRVTIYGTGVLYVGAEVPDSPVGIGYQLAVTCQNSWNF